MVERKKDLSRLKCPDCGAEFSPTETGSLLCPDCGAQALPASKEPEAEEVTTPRPGVPRFAKWAIIVTLWLAAGLIGYLLWPSQKMPDQKIYHLICNQCGIELLTVKQPPILCPECGKGTAFPAMKCEKCGHAFPASNMDVYEKVVGGQKSDIRCPKCNSDAIGCLTAGYRRTEDIDLQTDDDDEENAEGEE